MPAAPSSWRAWRWKRASSSGSRLSASASPRARRAASTSGRQATSVDQGVSGRVASGARPRRLPATYAVETAIRWGSAPSGVGVQPIEGRGHPDRSEQVDLDRRVERRVEADRGGRMDHGRARRQQLLAGGVEAQAVDADVAGHDEDPAVHLGRRSGRRARPRRRSKQLFRRISRRTRSARAPPPGADEQGHLAVGDAAQEPLGEGGPEEAGGAGDGDAPAGERFTEHC